MPLSLPGPVATPCSGRVFPPVTYWSSIERHGDIVVAALDGEFTVKELCLHPSPCLKAHNPAYPSLILDDNSQLDLFGVVTFVIHQTRRK